MKAFMSKFFCLRLLAMHSRLLLYFQRVFRESCLTPLRPALDSLHSMPQITDVLSFRAETLACKWAQAAGPSAF